MLGLDAEQWSELIRLALYALDLSILLQIRLRRLPVRTPPPAHVDMILALAVLGVAANVLRFTGDDDIGRVVSTTIAVVFTLMVLRIAHRYADVNILSWLTVPRDRREDER